MPSRVQWKSLKPTIEPFIFLYAYALFMHLPVIQQFIYKRISEARSFPYSSNGTNSCSKQKLNSSLQELEKEVQSLSSYVHLGIVMFASIPSVATALFIGAWTDTVGRRPALALPAVGSTIDAVVVLLTMYFKWPVYVLFVGSAINGFCGFFTTVVMGTMAYIADTTNESDRSYRLAIMEFLVFTGGMVSQFTSGLWIEKLGFIAAYWFILACLLSSVLYLVFFVPESRASSSERKSICSLFSLMSIKRVWGVYKNPRNGARRNLIIFMLSSGVIIITTLGLGGVMVLFVIHSPLCFTPRQVGYFSGYRFFMQGFGAVLGIKLLGICLSEINIIRAGLFSLAVALMTFGFSKTLWLVYLAPLVGVFAGAVVPIYRGMMSRTVGADEQGALFSATASVETLCNFLGAFIFSSMYPASLKFHFPGFVFFLGTVMLIIPVLLMCCLRNPASFTSKKDLFRSTQKDSMENGLLTNPVSGCNESRAPPLPSPTLTGNDYEALG